MTNKTNIRSWWTLNRAKVVQISTFFFLPRKWKNTIGDLVQIMDKIMESSNGQVIANMRVDDLIKPE